jgi:serine O-acetyltransferase
MGAVRIAYLANKAYKKVPLKKIGGGIAQILKNINRIIYSCDIAYQVEIPPETKLPHQGLGVVLHPEVILGSNCSIYQNVTLGERGLRNGKNIIAPVIGNNVVIGAGSVVLGGIKVGNNVVIGANSVVIDNVPDNAVVAGVPAKVKKYVRSE